MSKLKAIKAIREFLKGEPASPMTEQEWSDCRDPIRMIVWLIGWYPPKDRPAARATDEQLRAVIAALGGGYYSDDMIRDAGLCECADLAVRMSGGHDADKVAVLRRIFGNPFAKEGYP